MSVPGRLIAVEGLDGIEGLIHISELSDDHVEHPREVVSEGQRVTLRAISVDVYRRRLGLSIRRVSSDEYLETDWPKQSESGEDSPS